MRFVPRFIVCCLALVFVPISNSHSAERPNILLIMTDDQGYGDLRFHGNELIDTPVLDRLAQESTRFERFMVCPLCSMTRASLLTGRYNLRTGCASVTRGLETVRADELLIPEVLKTAGYATGCFGKWHIGEHYPSHPNGQGFDEFFGMPQGHWDNFFDPILEHNGKMVQTTGYITDVLTDAALNFIRQHRDGPFFCYVPFNAPHTPMQVPDYYYDKYKARGIEDNKTTAVYGMVQNIDENVARLLAVLDELEITRDTIVIFMSDNGPEGNRYNSGMRGTKGTVHEGGCGCRCSYAGRGKSRRIESCPS